MAALEHFSFNQDHTCVAVSIPGGGFKLFRLDPFEVCVQCLEGVCHDAKLVEMLHMTALVVFTSTTANSEGRSLIIYNTYAHNEIASITFPSPIVSIQLNRKRIVTVLENELHIMDISGLKPIDTIRAQGKSKGLCALSVDDERPVLAYTDSSRPGAVHVCDAILPKARRQTIEATKHDVTSIAIDAKGLLLAIASEQGTLIRILRVSDGTVLQKLRRGTTAAQIHDLRFSLDGQFLSVCSSRGTVHVFKIESDTEGTRTGSAGTIKDRMNSFFDAKRSYASARLEDQHNTYHRAVISPNNDFLFVLNDRGFLFKFRFEEREGMTLLSTDNLATQ